MKRAIVYIVILGIACTALGIVIGVTGNKIYTKRHLPEIIMGYLLTHPPEERQRARIANILKQLNKEVGLSSEQMNKAEIILKNALPEINQAREEFKNAFARLREKSISQISAILDVEQKEKFQKLIARTEERWKKLINPKNK